jgi:putative transposase
VFESGRETYRFVTLRTHGRANLLAEPECKQLFLTQLSQTRKRFRLAVAGYVLLDDHAHLLFIIPEGNECAAVVNDLRAGFLRAWRAARPREDDAPFWEHGLETREVDKRGELRAYLDFIHYDPVRHGLVERAADYSWSSLPARIAQGVLPEDWAMAGPPAGIARVLRE